MVKNFMLLQNILDRLGDLSTKIVVEERRGCREVELEYNKETKSCYVGVTVN